MPFMFQLIGFIAATKCVSNEGKSERRVQSPANQGAAASFSRRSSGVKIFLQELSPVVIADHKGPSLTVWGQ